MRHNRGPTEELVEVRKNPRKGRQRKRGEKKSIVMGGLTVWTHGGKGITGQKPKENNGSATKNHGGRKEKNGKESRIRTRKTINYTGR